MGIAETVSGAAQFWGPHCKKHINKLGEGHWFTEMEFMTWAEAERSVCAQPGGEKGIQLLSSIVL